MPNLLETVASLTAGGADAAFCLGVVSESNDGTRSASDGEPASEIAVAVLIDFSSTDDATTTTATAAPSRYPMVRSDCALVPRLRQVT